MKKLLCALTLLTGLLLPLTSPAQTETAVSLNFFYDNLSPYGSWIEVGDYGYCFQPQVAVQNADWRPYSDGYWAYTEDGWTWVSYEDFGWATYHYGRWTRLADYGWVWVPGYEWGPAWVSWREGGDYIGWAPLPPRAEPIYEGRAISGHVDLEFDIGPLYYNFVNVRYIGEPVLRSRLLPPQQNVTIIQNTYNITNITYRNSTVYNYGPDYHRINSYSERPIQRLSIQRENAPGNANGHNFNRVNGNRLLVVAPKVEKPKGKIAPKQVKATVKKPNIENGWHGIADRQKLQARMKKENAKDIPPPTVQPQKNRSAANGANAGEQGNAAPNRQRPAQKNNPPANAANPSPQPNNQPNNEPNERPSRSGQARENANPANNNNQAEPNHRRQNRNEKANSRNKAEQTPANDNGQRREQNQRVENGRREQPDRAEQNRKQRQEHQQQARESRANNQPHEAQKKEGQNARERTEQSQPARGNEEARRPQQRQAQESRNAPNQQKQPAKKQKEEKKAKGKETPPPQP